MNEQKETFPNKKETKIIIGIVVLVVLYFGFIGPYFEAKGKCLDRISYIPEGSGFGGMMSEHYKIGMQDFKTQNDAMGWCMRHRN